MTSMNPLRRTPRPVTTGQRVRPLLGFASVAVLVAIAAAGVPPKGSDDPALKSAGRVAPPSFTDERAEPEFDGFASLHAGTLDALVAGDPFVLPTADGIGIAMRLDSRGQFPDGTRTFTFSGDPDLGSDLGSSAALATRDGLVGGFVRPGGGLVLEVVPQGPGLQSLRWSGADLGCGGALAGPDDAAAEDEGGVAGGCNDSPLFQDVLIVYNSAAASALGGSAAAEIAISAAVATANQSFKNSQLSNRIRPVRVQQVDFPATGSAGSQLNDLATGAAGAPIRALRDQYGADLVQLVTVYNDACGLAYLFNGSPGSGFSTVAAGCISGFTSIHEFGHSFGCCHAVGDGGGCDTGGYYPFSTGYRFVGASGIQRRTIMAYSPGDQIGFFSNPYLQFDGRPLGSLTPPGTDNTRTIGLTSASVSNFRCSIVGAPDCNQNGVPDPVDLLDGTSVDCNLNLVPDECETGVDCTPDQVAFFPADSDPRILDAFGTSIEIGQRATPPDTSPYLGVGAFGDDASADNSGAAFVWRLNGTAWTQEAKLKSPTPRPNALFGWALAAHRRSAQVSPLPVVPERSFLAVGAYRQPGGTDAAPLVNQGTVYVYARNTDTPAGQWPLSRTVRPTDGLANALFGFAVDMTRVNADADDLLFTGAPTSGGKGAVFIHRIPTLDTATLPAARKIVFQYAPEGSDFGWSVAVDPLVIDPVNPADPLRRRAILVAGAPGYGDNSGRVKCHERTLTANALFNASGVTVGLPTALSQPGDRFGEAVAISDNLIAVGAPGRDASRGGVFIFRRTGLNLWNLVQSLPIGTTAAEGDRFGASVSLQLEANGALTLLVGAPRREVSTPGGLRVDAGVVYTYRMAPAATTFTLVRETTAFDARNGDQFGFSLFQRPAERWIGAPFNDDQGLNSGKAYLLPDPVTP
jgi:hypothetical protein